MAWDRIPEELMKWSRKDEGVDVIGGSESTNGGESTKVFAWISEDGKTHMGIRGRIPVLDEKTTAVCIMKKDVAAGMTIKPNSSCVFGVFRDSYDKDGKCHTYDIDGNLLSRRHSGYRIECTFQGYQDSGEYFDRLSKIWGSHTSHPRELARIGLLKINKVYTAEEAHE
jgi:hypothetical protein